MMHKMQKILLSVFLGVSMACGTAAVSAAVPAAEERQVNAENQAYWREMLQKYREDDQVNQVMLVRCTEGSSAIVQFYQKQTEQKNAWSLVFETDACIGKNGAGKTQEGDTKTPFGDFGVRHAFGILENPGTELAYVDVEKTTFACDEEGEYYNQIIDTAETGHACGGEEMYLYTPEYNYGIATDYNADNVYPLGSAIFLHCKGVKPFTGGCIAIGEEYMKTVLQHAQPGMRIIIHEEYADQSSEEMTAGAAEAAGAAETADTAETASSASASLQETEGQEQEIDYMALVNKLHPLPDGWEDALQTVTLENSVGDTVEVEEKAFAAYEKLRADLEENDGIYIELDSARRSVAEQQEIMDEFTEKYGADYAAKTVAVPGYSEHHTGLALDLYFRLDGEDIYYNEDMVQYPEIWEKIHAKLADYGFILRYLEGREHITGYGYEPWHIRYIDSAETAKAIMDEDITFEEYLGDYRAPEVEIDYGTSGLYTEEELKEAVTQIKCSFASWEGCELHSLRYAGDEANNEENLAWLNSLDEDAHYVQAAEFLGDFHSPTEAAGAWNPDEEYRDYQWWLGRTDDGSWEIVSFGY